MLKILIHTLCILIFFQTISAAQNILAEVKLDRLYVGSLDEVLASIEKEHHISFQFDSEFLKKFDVTERPFNSPLGSFLTGICKKYKLKYSIDESQVIHVINKTTNAMAVSGVSAKQISTSTVTTNEEKNTSNTNNLQLKDFSSNQEQKREGKRYIPQQIYEPENFNFTLSGFIKDQSTGEALPYANIVVKGTTNGTQSNANGFFTLLSVPSDTTSLEVSFIGYVTTLIRLTPKLPKENLFIEIEPSATELSAIEISAEREDLMQLNRSEGLSTIKISPKQVSMLPNIGEKDIMRSLQLMPGIASSNESSSGLYVRGGTPDQNLVLYDGFTVYQVDHLYGFFSAFNSNAIKDIQLYKGGYESRFGGRLSSVTELTGKDGNEKYFNAGAEVSLLGFNGFVEAPIGNKLTILAAGRRSYEGPIYNLIFDRFNKSNSQQNTATQGPGGVNQTKAKSYFYDLNAKISYRPTDKDVISLSFFNGTDNLDNSFQVGGGGLPSFPGSTNISLNISNKDLTEYGNTGASLKWNHNWSSKIFGSTLISYSYYFSGRDRTNSINITSLGDDRNIKFGTLENNGLSDISFKSDYTYQFLKNHQLGFGVFASKFLVNYSYSQNDTSTILSKKDNGMINGFYIQDKIKLSNAKLLITPGIRLNYFDVTSQYYFEPRLSASYMISSRFSVRFSTGRFYQFTNRIVREDILAGSKDFWLLSSNTNIPVSAATHFIGGVSYETKQFIFGIEGYYKYLENLSEYSLRFNNSPQGTSYEENFYNGNGYSQGIEFLAQKKSGKLTGWVSYTLSQTRNKFNVYAEDYYPANQDVTNEFKVVGMYKWRKWNFSATWIYATGKPYTSPSGAYIITLLDGSSKEYFSTTDKNSLRLPDYHRFDLSVTYNLLSPDQEREFGSLSFSIFNLYDRKNIWYKQYSIVDSKIVETDVTYLGFTPNLTLSLKLR